MEWFGNITHFDRREMRVTCKSHNRTSGITVPKRVYGTLGNCGRIISANAWFFAIFGDGIAKDRPLGCRVEHRNINTKDNVPEPSVTTLPCNLNWFAGWREGFVSSTYQLAGGLAPRSADQSAIRFFFSASASSWLSCMLLRIEAEEVRRAGKNAGPVRRRSGRPRPADR